MADAPSSSIQINIKGPSELKLQIDIAGDKTVRELKQAIADKSDVEADRQRLIYSGRVLKDEDPLATYKIQSGHTIHMVKGAARGATSTSASSTPQTLPTMQTGQNVQDPLTQLDSHRTFGGALGGFNPFTGMGVNQNDPNMLQNMLNSPEFLQQMSRTMSDPAVLDQLFASNPQLQAMGPQARQLFQSDYFRNMMSNPEALRNMLQMSAAMQGTGGPNSPFGGGGLGLPSFPAPGAHSGAPASTPASGAAPSATGAPPATGTPPAFDPAAFAQMMGMFGGAGEGQGAGASGGFNPWASGAGLFGAPPAAAADTRSPEERFQVQLQQLQDMGFSNAQQNVRALLATGGNVHSAIEYILGGGGL